MWVWVGTGGFRRASGAYRRPDEKGKSCREEAAEATDQGWADV